jgi:hypothetical protein
MYTGTNMRFAKADHALAAEFDRIFVLNVLGSSTGCG